MIFAERPYNIFLRAVCPHCLLSEESLIVFLNFLRCNIHSNIDEIKTPLPYDVYLDAGMDSPQNESSQNYAWSG